MKCVILHQNSSNCQEVILLEGETNRGGEDTNLHLRVGNILQDNGGLLLGFENNNRDNPFTNVSSIELDLYKVFMYLPKVLN